MGRESVDQIIKDLDLILSGNATKLVEDAEKLAEYLGKEKGMTTSQIRNIFAAVQRITNFKEQKRQVELLLPKIAYAARHKEVKDLREVLDKAIKKIGDDEKKFGYFKELFEAIVAYHRYYGKE